MVHCFTPPSCPGSPVTTPKDDDDEFDVSHIFVGCIKSLQGRRGKCLFFMTHFNDDDIPHVLHRLKEVHRTNALQESLETPQWHEFAQTHAYIDVIHAHPACNPESQ
jgi:hypothetical protein